MLGQCIVGGLHAARQTADKIDQPSGQKGHAYFQRMGHAIGIHIPQQRVGHIKKTLRLRCLLKDVATGVDKWIERRWGQKLRLKSQFVCLKAKAPHAVIAGEATHGSR